MTFLFLVFAVPTMLYFLPTLVALSRQARGSAGIVGLNLLLGWTVVGWVVALVLACSQETEAQAWIRRMEYERRLLLTSGAQPYAAPRTLL
jgi:hypothetical protein